MRRTSFLGILLLLCFSGVLPAQLNHGTLTGIVTDGTGAVVPNVPCTFTNTATGAVFKTGTNIAGVYEMPNLPIGPYTITLTAAGFKKLERTNLQLGTNQVLRVDVTLEIGAVTESVEVSSEVALVQTDTPTVAVTMGITQVRDLPISFAGPDRGRLADEWMYEIVPNIWGNGWTAGTVNGFNQARQALFDGTPAGANNTGIITEGSLSIEAIQESQVITSAYSAEFGRIAAGVFNFTMKSGTNEMHGSVYGELRNEALNANTWTGNFNGQSRGLDRKQDYAFSFGAPVYLPKVYSGRNKTFFYATFERYRNHLASPGPANATYPLAEFYNGDFSRLISAGGNKTVGTDALGNSIIQGEVFDPSTIYLLPNGRYEGQMFPGNQIPLSRFSKVSQNINKIGMAHYLPTFKDPATGLYPLQLNANYPTTTQMSFYDQTQFSLKLDHNISDKHKLSGSTDYTRRTTREPRAGMFDWSDPTGGIWNDMFIQPLNTLRFRVAEDWIITPRWFNHLQGWWNRLANPMTDQTDGTDGAAAYGIPGLHSTNYPTINWGGGPVYPLSNTGTQFHAFNAGTQWGYEDTISVSKGRHFMKMGYENLNQFWVAVNSQSVGFTFSSATTTLPGEQVIGSYTGYAFASYLLGLVNSASLSVPAPTTRRSVYHALYFQDDFKVRPNLTLNLGLRWDYSPPGFESHDRQDSWNPNTIDPLVNLPGAFTFAGNCSGCTGKRTFGVRDFNNFGPRIGFAWQPLSQLTIRGAYTITYIGDDTGTDGAGSTAVGGLGPDIVGNGTNNLAANATYPWQALFNWDNGLPNNIFVPPVRNPSYADTIGTATEVDPRYGTAPYVQQWNLNIQRQLPGKTLLDIGYMGNKGTKLRTSSLMRIDQTPASVISQYGANLPRTITSAADAANYGVPYPFPGFSGSVNSALRQFPQLRSNNTVTTINEPEGMSTYESLTLILSRQVHQGLMVYGDWVWSKSLDNMNSMLDYYNRGLGKTISAGDQPDRIKILAEYQLPVGRGKTFLSGSSKIANALLGGWSVSGIAQYFSGTPIGFSGASSINGWNGGTPRMNVAPGQLKLSDINSGAYNYANRLSNPASNKFFNTSLVTIPAPLTLGTAAIRYTYIRNWWTLNEDLSLQKDFRIREKYRCQVRAEFLDALNRHSMPGPTTNATNPNFGYMTGNPANSRIGQVGARLDF